MKNKLNILQISTPSDWRGGEQQAFYLLDELKQMNVATEMLCPQHSIMQHRCEEKNFSTHTFGRKGVLGINIARAIQTLCKKNKYDIIHTHDSHAHSAAVIAAAWFKIKSRIVVSRRVDFAVSDSIFSKWKYNHPQIEKIICVSNAIKQITKPAIQNKKRLEVVYSGIDIQQFNSYSKGKLRKEFSIGDDTKIVVNTSALVDHKDYHTFVNAANLIKEKIQDVKFFIIGEGPMEESIKKYIDFHQSAEFIHLTGFRKDVKELLMDADVFMMSSKTEGLGTSLLDAMAAHIPVVATRAGGIPEIIEEPGNFGLLADVGNPLQLADHCCALLSNSEMANHFAEQGAIRAKQFSKSITAQNILSIYQSIA
ncbi:MAG TPA: glycosyltransferase family 4 protein [Bacteroidia bacterium]|nr:glycosyltransferase family 4 protein [Bacteroidia bacterium]HNT79672.1 glycosyltransferase family 4 protein [Bacteroidia bacterium]